MVLCFYLRNFVKGLCLDGQIPHDQVRAASIAGGGILYDCKKISFLWDMNDYFNANERDSLGELWSNAANNDKDKNDKQDKSNKQEYSVSNRSDATGATDESDASHAPDAASVCMVSIVY